MNIRHRVERRQVNARLLLADQNKAPVRAGLRGCFQIVILNAALQRADEAEDGVRDVPQILRHRLRLRCLYKTLKIRAVRDHDRVRLRGTQALGQRVGGGEGPVGLPCQLQLHPVDERGVHQPAVGRVPVNAVIDQPLVRHQIHEIRRHRRIDPEHGVCKAMLLHLPAHEPRHAALVQLVDPAEFVKERQHRRQTVDGDILLRVHALLFVIAEAGPCRFVLQRGQIRDRRVKIQDLGVRDAAHHLLLARRDGIPRRGGQTNDLSHFGSSRSSRAAVSFSAARVFSRSVE